MKMVLFDCNGTLFDDMPIWYESVSEIFRTFGKEPIALEAYFREFRGDFLEIYRSRGIDASREELDAIYERALTERLPQVKLAKHAPEAIEELAAKQIVMGIITAQKDFLILPILDKFGITQFFKYRFFYVFAKNETIKQILELEGVRPEETYFIGDSPSDIRHAKKAGVKSIAFLNGYIPKELLLETNPDLVLTDFNELPQYI